MDWLSDGIAWNGLLQKAHMNKHGSSFKNFPVLRKVCVLAFSRFISQKKLKNTTITGYTYKQDLTTPYALVPQRTGLYIAHDGDPVVIKQTPNSIFSSEPLFLLNEAAALSYLKDAHITSTPFFPNMRDTIQNDHIIAVVTDRITGPSLEILQGKDRMVQLEKCAALLCVLADKTRNTAIDGISHRGRLALCAAFAFFLFRTIIKEPMNTLFHLRNGVRFYQLYLSGSIVSFTTALAHRDLFADNIIIQKNNPVILDWESAAITDEFFDLSQYLSIYGYELNDSKFRSAILQRTRLRSSYSRIAALIILNTYLILAHTDQSHNTYKKMRQDLLPLLKRFEKQFLRPRTLFERINTLTLLALFHLYQFLRFSSIDPSRKIILCYHSVDTDGWRFTTHPDLLREHLELLRNHGKLVSLSELMNSNTGGIAITFDDGYENNLTVAQPILAEYGVQPTLFALSDSARANRAELQNNRALLTPDKLKKLHSLGWEIGSHTATHPDLRTCSDAELDEEINGSKKTLETLLGYPIQFFAYPRGIFNDRIVAAVAKAGYAYAFTVDGAAADPAKQHQFRIDRVPVEGDLSKEELLALISPAGLLVSRVFLRVLQLKERIITRLKVRQN